MDLDKIRILSEGRKWRNAIQNLLILSLCLLTVLVLIVGSTSENNEVFKMLSILYVSLILTILVIGIINFLYRQTITLNPKHNYRILINTDNEVGLIEKVDQIDYCGNYIIDKHSNQKIELDNKAVYEIIQLKRDNFQIQTKRSKTNYLLQKPTKTFKDLGDVFIYSGWN